MLIRLRSEENGASARRGKRARVAPTSLPALAAATSNAAKALGWDAWLGALEAGKVAGLSVHEKNPLEDLRSLADQESLRFVMKDGEVVASHAGSVLPKEALAKQTLTIR